MKGGSLTELEKFPFCKIAVLLLLPAYIHAWDAGSGMG